jgi:hypothetical protein
MWGRKQAKTLTAASTYDSAPTCDPCGGTPLFVKWAAERIAESYGRVGSQAVRCPHHKGWHVVVAERMLPSARRY